jgi:hypothetical protein
LSVFVVVNCYLEIWNNFLILNWPTSNFTNSSVSVDMFMNATTIFHMNHSLTTIMEDILYFTRGRLIYLLIIYLCMYLFIYFSFHCFTVWECVILAQSVKYWVLISWRNKSRFSARTEYYLSYQTVCHVQWRNGGAWSWTLTYMFSVSGVLYIFSYVPWWSGACRNSENAQWK